MSGFRKVREIVTFPPGGIWRGGDEGQELVATGMARFKADDFGNNHCQARVIKQKLGQVGLFGWWLEQHTFGKYITWEENASGDHV